MVVAQKKSGTWLVGHIISCRGEPGLKAKSLVGRVEQEVSAN